MPAQYPSYLNLLATGELARRAAQAVAGLSECVGCARQCHADRLQGGGRAPFCRTGRLAVVSSFFPHHGEEDCLRGVHGSGTIFFSQCNLRCVFCQNFDISWQGAGTCVEPPLLARIMLDLQRRARDGLHLPIVYNTGGYDSVDTLRLLDGVVDIYMPDYKMTDAETAQDLLQAADYPEVVCRALREMQRQVGDLVVDESGIARRGLLVRHLVMPHGKAGTRAAMRFLAREISPHTFVNIMRQYRPAGYAESFPSIDRPVTHAEWAEAVQMAREEGLSRFDHAACQPIPRGSK
ncbi:MAG: hypothetical protein MUF48_24745 [Pirellulaceae bacterium]|nr:hypothetical protein [Pirellulaceae bacterium]